MGEVATRAGLFTDPRRRGFSRLCCVRVAPVSLFEQPRKPRAPHETLKLFPTECRTTTIVVACGAKPKF